MPNNVSKLNFHNYVGYYFCHPGELQQPKDRLKARVISVCLGVFTLGIALVGMRLFLYDPKKYKITQITPDDAKKSDAVAFPIKPSKSNQEEQTNPSTSAFTPPSVPSTPPPVPKTFNYNPGRKPAPTPSPSPTPATPTSPTHITPIGRTHNQYEMLEEALNLVNAKLQDNTEIASLNETELTNLKYELAAFYILNDSMLTKDCDGEFLIISKANESMTARNQAEQPLISTIYVRKPGEATFQTQAVYQSDALSSVHFGSDPVAAKKLVRSLSEAENELIQVHTKKTTRSDLGKLIETIGLALQERLLHAKDPKETMINQLVSSCMDLFASGLINKQMMDTVECPPELDGSYNAICLHAVLALIESALIKDDGDDEKIYINNQAIKIVFPKEETFLDPEAKRPYSVPYDSAFSGQLGWEQVPICSREILDCLKMYKAFPYAKQQQFKQFFINRIKTVVVYNKERKSTDDEFFNQPNNTSAYRSDFETMLNKLEKLQVLTRRRYFDPSLSILQENIDMLEEPIMPASPEPAPIVPVSPEPAPIVPVSPEPAPIVPVSSEPAPIVPVSSEPTSISIPLPAPYRSQQEHTDIIKEYFASASPGVDISRLYDLPPNQEAIPALTADELRNHPWLSEVVNTLFFKVQNNNHDPGNCCVAALAQVLFGFNKNTGKVDPFPDYSTSDIHIRAIRVAVSAYMIKNPKEFYEFLEYPLNSKHERTIVNKPWALAPKENTDDARDDVIKAKARTIATDVSNWFTTAELTALSKIVGRPIYIINASRLQFDGSSIEMNKLCDDQFINAPIYLKLTSIHYDFMIPKRVGETVKPEFVVNRPSWFT